MHRSVIVLLTAIAPGALTAQTAPPTAAPPPAAVEPAAPPSPSKANSVEVTPPEPATAPKTEPQTAPEAKPATPAATEEKPAEDASVPARTIAKGDNLSKIADQVYGNGGYHIVLKYYNKADPKKLKVGQVIKTPDLLWLMEREKVVPLMADAVTEIMEGRAAYMEVEGTLRTAAKSAKRGKVAVDEAVKAKLLEAQTKVTAAMQKFTTKREGMAAVPEITGIQLRTVSELLGGLASGKSAKYAKDIDMVHAHLANALVYASIWAQKGYQ